jgi:ABC-type glutathione transport system ATPase component
LQTQSMEKEVVAAERLTVAYGERIAVRQASLTLRSHEVTGLLGVSGSGKSTLARVLIGKPPEGASVLSGWVDRNGVAALVPQEPSLALNPYLQVGEQVRHCSPTSSEAEILDLFRSLGLEQPAEIYRRHPHQLSGGQQQRVVWAQALIRKPDLLVADEPTSALDSILQREIAEAVAALVCASGRAVLWISHDPYLLAAVCARILVMHGGRIVEDDTPRNLLSSPKTPMTRRLIEAAG